MKNIKNFYLYKYLAAKFHELTIKCCGPKNEMRRAYCKVYHKYPNIEDPRNLIEKIYWMQLHADTSMWTRCAYK